MAPGLSSAVSLRAGVGRADITPGVGTRLMGYPIEDRVAQSIHDPLHATALVLENGNLKTAIVSIDTTIIDDDVVAAIRDSVQSRAGIIPDLVTLCSIQTHTGPATQSCFGWGEADQAYIDGVLLPGVVDAVAKAAASLVPVRLGIGTLQSQVGVNRREIRPDHSVSLGVNPWGPYDPTMTVLRFEGMHGPVAILVHYGAHPTSIGPAWIVSRDWPGVMVDHVEKLTGAITLFLNGAVGDVGPRLDCGRTTGDGIESAFEVGFRAAADAVRALNSVKEMRDVPLTVHTEDILLPYRSLPNLEEARRRMMAAEADKECWGAPMCEYLHWRAVIEAHQRPALAGKRYRQTITRLGPVVLVPFPGEPFSEIVLRVRQYSPFQYTLCVSTTNGSNGYFVSREARHRGGYEVWVGQAFGPYLLAENIDDILVESNCRLLDKMARDES
jgi:neutral ceramidase